MDATGQMSLKWFRHPKGMEKSFTLNKWIFVSGKVKFFMNRPEMLHPEIIWNANPPGCENNQEALLIPESSTHKIGRIVPIYIEVDGVPTTKLRKILWEAIQYSDCLHEDLPEHLTLKHKLPLLSQAIKDIHFPPPDGNIEALHNFNTPAHARLIYEEFLKFEYLVIKQRQRAEKESAKSFGPNGGTTKLNELKALLPFRLTNDQESALKDILRDFLAPHPMNRLIQGDVGSGKTAVAFLTAGAVIGEGYQAALMAPTEILAEQHFNTAINLFHGELNVALLTGKTKAKERKELISRLASGEPMLLIGTHALIEDPVKFKNLSYILIDEQHRFGVEQRLKLRKKGIQTDSRHGHQLHPHTLVLTATPIPRTLALTVFGDLFVTTIREKPPGRSPVKTKLVSEENKTGAYSFIYNQLKKGHQAYFIYPLVEESEAEGFQNLKDAVSEAENLKKSFPEFEVGLLHGQLKGDEKNKIMEAFKRNEIQILVSTTVVEVGVDVPNATVMAVAHAERFGLSQLHQLRGRVGRSHMQSYCYLFYPKYASDITSKRLNVLETTDDGFIIAQADLEIRGPGEFLGTRQSGSLPFKIANLIRDESWLFKARDDALDLLKTDPELEDPKNATLKAYYVREGNVQFEWLKTS